jgi:hypothetical protein
MNVIEKYQYRKLERITYPNGARHYICPDSGKKLPSVTTVLDRTSVKSQLIAWRNRVGDKKANQIIEESRNLGTLLHRHLEHYILGQQRPGGNNHIRLMAERMADQIIQQGLTDVSEVWGSETMLYVPQLFAGTTDVVGLYKGSPAIMDFKTAKKMRTRDMIEDYFLQLSGYGIAHDELYGTHIQTGVIFMVNRDCVFEQFIVEGNAFIACKQRFFQRLEQFLALDS